MSGLSSRLFGVSFACGCQPVGYAIVEGEEGGVGHLGLVSVAEGSRNFEGSALGSQFGGAAKARSRMLEGTSPSC